MTVFIEDSFEVAHWLPNVPAGQECGSMRTYHIRLEVTGEVGSESGWVIDYADLKYAWSIIKADLDHRLLNDLLPNSTCELIALYIGQQLPMVSRIELRETVHCGVVWQR